MISGFEWTRLPATLTPPPPSLSVYFLNQNSYQKKIICNYNLFCSSIIDIKDIHNIARKKSNYNHMSGNFHSHEHFAHFRKVKFAVMLIL